MAGVLNASLAHFESMSVEKPSLLSRVRTKENEGESIRSAVSSSRWRSLETVCEDDGLATPSTPDSRSTCSSSSFGGRRQESHFLDLGLKSESSMLFKQRKTAHRLSSSVSPSTFLRICKVKSDSLDKLISSRGFKGPKTSSTAGCTRSINSFHPRCSSHQLKARYRRFVSKSSPRVCVTSSSWSSKLMVEAV